MLSFLSRLSAILPIIFFLCFLPRNRTGGFWVIFVYCLLSFITDNTFSGADQQKFYIFSTFTIIEYTLYSIFLHRSLKEKIFKTIIVCCSVAFFIVAIWHMSTEQAGTKSFDSLSASLEATLIIIYSIFYFYEQIRNPEVFYIYYLKKFWMVLAFLIYLSATLFLFIYAATFTTQEHKSYWGINNISDIIKNLFFTISFSMRNDKKQQNPLDSLYTDL